MFENNWKIWLIVLLAFLVVWMPYQFADMELRTIPRKKTPEQQKCQEKHPHIHVRVMDGRCYYSSEFGWIESGRQVYKLKPKRNRKVF